MSNRRYYHAYDDRYKQVHSLNLQWFNKSPSAILLETVREFSISKSSQILEVGCGEGRDAFELINQGFNILATDVSPAAITFCQSKMPNDKERFLVLDCLSDSLRTKFDFIYAIAVVHMLVPDADRNAFYSFIYEHLNDNGIALICAMGDGIHQRQTDICDAFDLQDRIHEPSGTLVQIASTSCRIVDFQDFCSEIHRNNLQIIKQGITSIEPDFPQMMFAVISKTQ